MIKERRWLKSAVIASLELQIALPWQRGSRRRPEAIRPVQALSTFRAKLSATAAH